MHPRARGAPRQAALLLLLTATAVAHPLPMIDLAPWMSDDAGQDEEARNAVVDQIRDACQSIGFFSIRNHGVSDWKAWLVTHSFFQSDEKRLYQSRNQTEYPYGFEESEQLSKGKALDGRVEEAAVDSKETFSIGPNKIESGMPLRRWQSHDPDSPLASMKEVLEDYYQQMEDLSLILLHLFSLALGMDGNYFAQRMTHHMSALRLVHYYPLPSQTQLPRAGAHTDYGALTILNPQKPGLQVLMRNDALNQSDWYSVPVEPGVLVINLGDLMQRWTNGEYQ